MNKDDKLLKLEEEGRKVLESAQEAMENLGREIRALDLQIGKIYYEQGQRFYKEFNCAGVVKFRNMRLSLIDSKHEVHIELDHNKAKKLAYDILGGLCL